MRVRSHVLDVVCVCIGTAAHCRRSSVKSADGQYRVVIHLVFFGIVAGFVNATESVPAVGVRESSAGRIRRPRRRAGLFYLIIRNTARIGSSISDRLIRVLAVLDGIAGRIYNLAYGSNRVEINSNGFVIVVVIILRVEIPPAVICRRCRHAVRRVVSGYVT